jgi:hypothetical protein
MIVLNVILRSWMELGPAMLCSLVDGRGQTPEGLDESLGGDFIGTDMPVSTMAAVIW